MKKCLLPIALLILFVVAALPSLAQAPVVPGGVYDEGIPVGQPQDFTDDKGKALNELERARARERQVETRTIPEEAMTPAPPVSLSVEPAGDLQTEEPQETYYNLADIKDILYFFSYIEVIPDGKLIINDTIKISSSSPYRNGIVRSFPLSYRNINGYKVTNFINVVSVTVNGIEVPYRTFVTSDAVKVEIYYIPQYLNQEVNTIGMFYRVNSHLLFAKDRDELFWDVLGNGFSHNILSGGATIILPKGAQVKDYFAFLNGREQEQAFIAKRDADGNIGFTMVEPIKAGHSFSLYASWNKGLVDRTAARFSFDVLVERHGLALTSGLILLVVLCYYIIVFLTTNNDKDFFRKRQNALRVVSPGVLRVILRKKYDNKVFVASLLDFMLKIGGKIRKEEGEIYLVKGQGKVKLRKNLHKALFRVLFPAKKTELKLDAKGRGILRKAFVKARFFMDCRVEWFFLYQNRKYLLMPFFLSFVSIITGAFLTGLVQPVLFYGMILVIGAYIFLGCMFLLKRISKRLKTMKMAFVVLFLLIGVAFINITVGGLAIGKILGLPEVLLLVSVPVVVLSFHILFSGSGMTARYIHESQANYKNTLVANIEIMNEKLLWSTFERYVAYAVALDIEDEYDAKFFAHGSPEELGYEASWVPEQMKNTRMLTERIVAELDKVI